MTCNECADIKVDRDQWRRLALTLQQNQENRHA